MCLLGIARINLCAVIHGTWFAFDAVQRCYFGHRLGHRECTKIRKPCNECVCICDQNVGHSSLNRFTRGESFKFNLIDSFFFLYKKKNLGFPRQAHRVGVGDGCDVENFR